MQTQLKITLLVIAIIVAFIAGSIGLVAYLSSKDRALIQDVFNLKDGNDIKSIDCVTSRYEDGGETVSTKNCKFTVSDKAYKSMEADFNESDDCSGQLRYMDLSGRAQDPFWCGYIEYKSDDLPGVVVFEGDQVKEIYMIKVTK